LRMVQDLNFNRLELLARKFISGRDLYFGKKSNRQLLYSTKSQTAIRQPRGDCSYGNEGRTNIASCATVGKRAFGWESTWLGHLQDVGKATGDCFCV
jgi:hypothetical protein